ncbi:MAG: dipeptide ABC transporter ATP-binding protein [Hyphomonadaceae bacterium]|jgi:oligopeptide/dipeptide ABC transporter ATP-binding protein|nr:dipeptide ABC transporter ATP-binding protein [Hyphomonadaceae bacterium]
MSASSLLVLEDVTKHFVLRRSLLGTPTMVVRAVDGVSLTVAAGETLALVGESGCGKSTVGRLALRLIDPTAGKVRLDGRDLASLTSAELRGVRASAQLIFQDPYGSLNPRMTVGEMLAEPLLLHTDLSRASRRDRVAELLGVVGLKGEHAQRYPHEFSGGQRQRIAIARALAVEPRLIVCDEPVSALDVSIRSQILNLLKELQQRLGLAYVFISHDLAVVKHIATRVAVMYLGRIVESAACEAIFAEPRHPYTQALLSAVPALSSRGRRHRRILPGDPPSPVYPPPGCHLHPRCAHAEEVCMRLRPALATGEAHATACHLWPDIVASLPPADVIGPEFSASLQRLFRRFEAKIED